MLSDKVGLVPYMSLVSVVVVLSDKVGLVP